MRPFQIEIGDNVGWSQNLVPKIFLSIPKTHMYGIQTWTHLLFVTFYD